MTDSFTNRVRELCREQLPLPGSGRTPERHRRLFEIAREDLSLAKLVEAHFDALSILAEAGREPTPDAIYAVWASEIPGQGLVVGADQTLSGCKPFCSGGQLVDRALVTLADPKECLLEVELRRHPATVIFDLARWKIDAFRLTQTGGVTFNATPVEADAVIGAPGFYLCRPGFWHGACGPAACWAGGVAGLLDFARTSKRDDPHTLAHLAAMESNGWALQALLDATGREIDAAPHDQPAAHRQALRLRHIVEQLSTDTLRRFARAYGPHPLTMNEDTARRFSEAEIFLRQCHAERDLEALARALRL